jgi:hypothetical protein
MPPKDSAVGGEAGKEANKAFIGSLVEIRKALRDEIERRRAG